MKKMALQKGFLLIVGVVLLVVVALFSSAVIYMYVKTSSGGASYIASKQSFYIAEAGIEKGIYDFLKRKITCTQISSTPLKFANGEYQITATKYTPTAFATLTADPVLDTGTNTYIIPVSSVVGYAPEGRVMLEHEVIDYTGVNQNPPQLTGATRGASGTKIVNHPVGTQVIQSQCTISSIGGVPNLSSKSSSRGRRGVSTHLMIIPYSYQIWIVGDKGGIFYWNNDQWIRYPQNYTTTTFNSISMASDGSDGWIVGNADNGKFTILRWNGSNWVDYSFNPGLQVGGALNLTSVSIVNQNDAWAVGQALAGSGSDKTNRYTILHWNGSQWCVAGAGSAGCSGITIPTNSSSNVDLASVSVVANPNGSPVDVGYAVGSNGVALRLSAVTGNPGALAWVQTNPIPGNPDLTSVFLTSNKEAWTTSKNAIWRATSVGDGNWTWTASANPIPGGITEPNVITMLDTTQDGYANYGWVFGNGGHRAYYNNGAWVDAGQGQGNGNASVVVDANHAWVVGQGQNRASYYNDGTWQDVRPDPNYYNKFYGIAKVELFNSEQPYLPSNK